mgnify:CR=1 FL=1
MKIEVTEDLLKEAIRQGLRQLGVDVIGSFVSPYHRSYSDLGTDLAPLVVRYLVNIESQERM